MRARIIVALIAALTAAAPAAGQVCGPLGCNPPNLSPPTLKPAQQPLQPAPRVAEPAHPVAAAQPLHAEARDLVRERVLMDLQHGDCQAARGEAQRAQRDDIWALIGRNCG